MRNDSPPHRSRLFLRSSSSGSPPAVLRIGNAAEPRDLDPQLVTGIPEGKILINLFEGLVGKAPKTSKPIPGVAESWSFSKGRKADHVQAARDAKWSNGDAVTARDFVYSWTRLLNPATAAEYAYYGYYFKGGRDFNRGNAEGLRPRWVSKPSMTSPC